MFYFGNAAGDSGNSTTDARVNTSDQLGPRNHPTANAAITDRFDYNRDGQVNSTDELLARNNPTGHGNALKLIDLGAPIVVLASGVSASPVAIAANPIASALALSTITTLDPATRAAPARRVEAYVESAVEPRTSSLAARVDAVLELELVQSDAKGGAEVGERTAESFQPDDDWLAGAMSE